MYYFNIKCYRFQHFRITFDLLQKYSIIEIYLVIEKYEKYNTNNVIRCYTYN